MSALDGVRELLDSIESDDDVLGNQEVVPENIDHIPADDTVSLYFRQMAAEPLLTAEQEIALAKRIERGRKAAELLAENPDLPAEQIRQLEEAVAQGQAAREHLGRANTRLVVSIAKRYRDQGLPMSDLIQEGNVGLMIAVDKFDYTMGNRFSTYASWWIRQTITRALSQKSRTIRLPLHLSDQLRRINVANEILEQELGREPTYKELAERLGVETSEVRETLEANPQTIPLELPVGEDSEFGDFLEDEESVGPDEAMHTLDLTESIERVLNDLLPREAEILRLRFGLKDGIPQTLEQVGKAMGLSRERIRQIERQALRRLRQPQFAA
ncbi:MAG TPA: sigma-70 family RNA polymerase sigma factor, partial [Aggregatilineales bacterium]|nr:sigma-70 family RNA polymerase sigma factor [Aggregatilineales bacterium]